MPAIDILKNWDLKKHGLTGLVVTCLFMGYEICAPKDRSCENQVKYLQLQNTALINQLIDERNKSVKKDTIIKYYKVKDSVWQEKTVKPAKAIVKSTEQ
jgi:hypothetical protein